jgi:hypothetical protein
VVLAPDLQQPHVSANEPANSAARWPNLQQPRVIGERNTLIRSLGGRYVREPQTRGQQR